jgi:acyl-CoA synthetase (AMP-forming)/AMP-acid ligase II
MSEWNLGELFEVVAGAVPDRDAVVADGERTTCAELDRRSDRVAALLADHGVTGGDRVGLLLRNGRPYLEVMLATFKLGVTPFNVHDRYTSDELRVLFDDAEPRLVVHEPDLAPRLAGTVTGGGLLAVDGAYEHEAATGTRPRPARTGGPDDRYILYTGGTTGGRAASCGTTVRSS